MNRTVSTPRSRERGQILVVAVLGFIAMIAGAALVLEGGNAYAQQRVAQNGSDAAANAGAVAMGQRLAGVPVSDGTVLAAVTSVANANAIDSFIARYTDVSGRFLDNNGAVVGSAAQAAVVGPGDGVDGIPTGAQGVAVDATRTFNTVLGRVVGINAFDASATATAVAGLLVGGNFLPLVIPISIVDCDTNGNLGSVPEDTWAVSDPGSPPVGPEYIVPLCKTGGGSFQVLDLDPTQRCDEEIANPPYITWETLPVVVGSDNGNNCAKPITDYVNANLTYRQGETVLLPICDNALGDPCGTEGGSRATYRITKVAAFAIDYMSDTNNRNNPACATFVRPDGTSAQPIAGNGSSSCLVGWFVRIIHAGPVGSGTVGNADAIGVQLIK